jgi:hypothetical protein
VRPHILFCLIHYTSPLGGVGGGGGGGGGGALKYCSLLQEPVCGDAQALSCRCPVPCPSKRSAMLQQRVTKERLLRRPIKHDQYNQHNGYSYISDNEKQCSGSSQNSSVGTARGWTARVRFPAGAKHFCLFHSFQTGCGAHPASYPIGTGGKAAGAVVAGHSPQSSADVKNVGAIASTTPTRLHSIMHI